MKNGFKSRRGGCLGFIIKWVLIVAVIAFALVYFFAGRIVDTGIMAVSKTAGVKMGSSTKIDFVPLRLEMNDFYITNPEGFSDAQAVSFKQVVFQMPITPSLLDAEKPIVIHEVRVISPHLVYEKNGLLSDNNFTEIQNKFAKLIPTSSAPAKKDDKKDDSGASRKVIIKKIVFEDGTITTVISGQSVKMPLPSFTIENIGGTEGVSPTVAAGQIFVDVFAQAISSVAKNLTKAAGDLLKSGSDMGSDALKSGTDAVRGTLKTILGE